MGRDKSIIAKHVACHVTKHSADSPKENMLSLLTGQGTEYCCMLLSQIRPEGKILSSQIVFCAHSTQFTGLTGRVAVEKMRHFPTQEMHSNVAADRLAEL